MDSVVNFKNAVSGILVIAFLLIGIDTAFGQLKEPEVATISQPRTPASEGFHNAWSVDVFINNFGFGIGGEYRRVIGPYTQLTFKTGITGIRDVSEQSFQDFFSGQKLIPNKYNRALGFPFLIGVRHRLFAEEIADNFRFFVSTSVGPAMAFVFPYLNDFDNNGYRTLALQNGVLIPIEPFNDFFSGWSDGETKWGGTGELKIGVEIGDNFKHPTTLEFGYFFYYFDQGIQLMEPRRPQTNDRGQIIINQDGTIPSEPFFDKQKYFGTPQISITFGGMW